MEILQETSSRPIPRATAAIGFFDGVHCGHRFLLSRVVSIARSRGEVPMAVTFRRHPAEVLRPGGGACPLLSTFEERCALIAEAGIGYCAVLDFTSELSRLSAEGFMREYLAGRFNVGTLVVGYDHSFGHDAGLSFDDYRSLGGRIGIYVEQAGEYTVSGGGKVSSTGIRRRLAEGDVATAAVMLGRSYAICGTVAEGSRIGRQIGFPTANIDTSGLRKVVPGCGVYACTARIDGAAYAAVVNIGTRPTVCDGGEVNVEAHLLGFSGDIYGRLLCIEFAARLRDERRFASVDELRSQIARDAHEAGRLVGNRLPKPPSH